MIPEESTYVAEVRVTLELSVGVNATDEEAASSEAKAVVTALFESVDDDSHAVHGGAVGVVVFLVQKFGEA